MNFTLNKTKTPEVNFITTVPGLNLLKDCLPKPAKEYIPQWWKETPTIKTEKTWDGSIPGNMKVCPSFSDYFTKGYIVPMWVDSHLYYDSSNKDWKWATADGKFIWESHGNSQYLDYVDHKFLNKDSFFIFKIQLPWSIFTTKGYSLYQLPTFFHFNEDFSVVPGVRDTDIYHEMSIQLLIHSDKKEIFIPRGTPLAQYIPFKREKTKYNVREANKKDLLKINAHNLNFSTRFILLESYLKDRKNNK
jgi:hypothetical protein